jgi:hypothetical protein
MSVGGMPALALVTRAAALFEAAFHLERFVLARGAGEPERAPMGLFDGLL